MGSNLKLRVKAAINLRTIEIKRVDEKKSEFHLYSLHHQAVYETDPQMIENVNTLSRLIEEKRSAIHQNSLINVGATHLATKLSSGSQRVTQGTGFRRQVSKSDDEDDEGDVIVPRVSDSFL